MAEEEGGEWVVVETDLAPDVGRFSAGWRGEPGDGGVAASGDSFWGVAEGCDWGGAMWLVSYGGAAPMLVWVRFGRPLRGVSD